MSKSRKTAIVYGAGRTSAIRRRRPPQPHGVRRAAGGQRHRRRRPAPRHAAPDADRAAIRHWHHGPAERTEAVDAEVSVQRDGSRAAGQHSTTGAAPHRRSPATTSGKNSCTMTGTPGAKLISTKLLRFSSPVASNNTPRPPLPSRGLTTPLPLGGYNLEYF